MNLPQVALQALDTALNHSAAHNAMCSQVARATFWQDAGRPYSLGGGAEVSLLRPPILACVVLPGASLVPTQEARNLPS